MQCADLEELRQKVTVQLSEHVSKQTDRSKREELFKVMGALIDFEVPPVLVDQTIDSMVQDFSFLKEEDKKKAKRDPSVRKSLAPEAKIKVKNTLILWQIGKDEGLNVDDEEVRAELRHRFAELANAGEQEMAKAMEKGGAHTRESLLLEKSMQALLAFTTFTPTPVSV